MSQDINPPNQLRPALDSRRQLLLMPIEISTHKNSQGNSTPNKREKVRRVDKTVADTTTIPISSLQGRKMKILILIL